MGSDRASDSGFFDRLFSGVKAASQESNRMTADRPAIAVNFERHEVVEQTVKALSRDQTLFRRGSVLGVVIQEQTDVMDLGNNVKLENAQGVSRFLQLSEAMVGCVITRNAVFFQRKRGSDGQFVRVRCHPPQWAIKAVESRGYWPGVQRLLTIANCP